MRFNVAAESPEWVLDLMVVQSSRSNVNGSDRIAASAGRQAASIVAPAITPTTISQTSGSSV